MNSFTIYPSRDYSTGEYYLNENIQAYYHQDYTTFGTPGNPDFINHLKNQFDDTSIITLKNSENKLTNILNEDLPKIQKRLGFHLTVCVIPRAKSEHSYSDNQKLFRKSISLVVDGLSGYSNGTSYIIRHTDTKTTHMGKSGYGGVGDMPYVGITKNTCTISNEVVGRNILLIDDIYTNGVNIDEDAIQALLDIGAKNVFFYAVGKTYKGGQRISHPRDNSNKDRITKKISFSFRAVTNAPVALAGSFLRDAGNLTSAGKMSKLSEEDFDPNNEDHRVFVIMDIADDAYAQENLTCELEIGRAHV